MLMFPILAALAAAAANTSADPRDVFFARLTALCGSAFEGRIASPPVEADRDFGGKRLLMHVRDCSEDEIRIPFAVGDDRSRTWVIRRRPALSLHHDHRHADGSEDRLTLYGGTASAEGSESRQLFPADDYSRALFVRENIPQSANNVWALEVQPGATFAYELRRPGRFFRVEFDLGRPVAPIQAASH